MPRATKDDKGRRKAALEQLLGMVKTMWQHTRRVGCNCDGWRRYPCERVSETRPRHNPNPNAPRYRDDHSAGVVTCRARAGFVTGTSAMSQRSDANAPSSLLRPPFARPAPSPGVLDPRPHLFLIGTRNGVVVALYWIWEYLTLRPGARPSSFPRLKPRYLTFFTTHSSTTRAMSRLFFSIITMWPLP